MHTEDRKFNIAHTNFKHTGAVLYGVSRDTLVSHQKYKQKFIFLFELITDSNEGLCSLFDVIKMNDMYGKKARSIECNTLFA